GTSSSTGRHLTQEEAAKEELAIRISKKFALLEEVRPVLETMAYHDKYKKVLDEIWKDKVELDGMIMKEEEEAIKKVKDEALKEKDDPRAFIFPIRLEGQVNENALADIGSDINTMSYRIYERLGREEMKKVDRGITMINHTQVEAMRILTNVLCQVGVTTLIAKFLILDIPIDRDAPILVGRGFLCTIGGIVNTLESLFSTFDGFCQQTLRAARSDVMRNKFAAPIYGLKPAPYLNCNDPAERSLALQAITNPIPKISGCYTKEEEAARQWRTEIRLWEETMAKPDHRDPNALDNLKLWRRYCFPKFTTSSCYRKGATEMRSREIDDMLRIKLREAKSNEEILTSVAWIRAFNIKKQFIQNFAKSFIQLMNLIKLGLYHADELEEDGFDVYFQGGLRSVEHFNAQEYWLSISREENLGYDKVQKNDLWLLSMFDARHQNGYANVAWSRKAIVLTDAVIRGLSALIYCRDLDTTTLKELIDCEGRLIPEDPQPGVPRVGIPRPSRASIQDLYERMGSMEIRQQAIERMEYKQSYHWDRYQGVFEHMAGVYNVPLQGAYNPPGYAQP
ncbi:putative reverse transcriptase, RNA-dependent DNA polymerase, partial [Tanacetum coccineum]